MNYIGIPFVDRACGFDGADCFGLIRLYYRHELGIEVPDPKISAALTPMIFDRYMEEIQGNWTTISEPENECVVAMAHDHRIPNTVQHFGIYTDGKILHTLKKVGSHIVALEKYRWAIKGYHKWQQS